MFEIIPSATYGYEHAGLRVIPGANVFRKAAGG